MGIPVTAVTGLSGRLAKLSKPDGIKSLYAMLNAGAMGRAIPIATHTALTNQGRLGGGDGNTSRSVRTVHFCPNACTNLEIEYANIYNGGSGETPNTNPIQVKCAIEYPVGAIGNTTPSTYPAYFTGGTRIGSIDGGAIGLFVCGINLPAGATCAVRTLVSVTTPASQLWPNGQSLVNSLLEGHVANVDAVDSGGMALSTANDFAPTCIRGMCFNPAFVPWFLGGDSIGRGDHGNLTLVNISAMQKAMNGAYPYIQMAMSGETAANAVGQLYNCRLRLAAGCRHATTNYGVNDLNAGQTAAQIIANQLKICAAFNALGIKYWPQTLVPNTTSSDNFTTVANQTVKSSEAQRVLYNDTLRSGGAGGFIAQAGGTKYAGVLDFGNAVEVNASNVPTVDGGFWICAPGLNVANWSTFDGIHPVDNGYVLMGNAIAGQVVVASVW